MVNKPTKKLPEKQRAKEPPKAETAKRPMPSKGPEAPPLPPVEMPAPPEISAEALPARERPAQPPEKESFFEEALDGMKRKLKRPKKKKPIQIPQVRDELTVKIESIMQQGLEEAYKELSIIEQQEFKIKGEQTALKIRDLMKSAHVKVKKIFRLLLEWLKMLPGINRFYLEQEAKIKADKVVALKHFDQKNNPKT